jgi:hypothetical protein
MRRAALLTLLAAALAAAPAIADPEADRREAEALLREGNRLLQDANDPAGALDLFVAAYAKFPSDKIWLSIGSAEDALGHAAAAANAYARFLASADAVGAPAREARAILAALDAKLGRVAIQVTPSDAEIQLGDGRWEAAAALPERRAAPGTLTIRARSPGHADGDTTVTVRVGATATAALALAVAVTAPPPDRVTPPGDPLVTPPIASVDRRSRFGVAGKLVVDGEGRGAGGVVGAMIAVGPVALDLAAIVGPTFGAYGGIRLGLGSARWRPVIGVGVPVFFDDGARIGARAAGGVEVRVSTRLRMSLELGAEYMLTRADDIDPWVLAPALAAEARL